VYIKKPDSGEDMLGMELGSFLKAVIDDGSPAVSIEEAAEALRVALDVDRIGKESLAKMLEAQPA
jgi:hypothetical protein